MECFGSQQHMDSFRSVTDFCLPNPKKQKLKENSIQKSKFFKAQRSDLP